uniref:spore coat protein n=1 Tax=Clostridium sp. 12(A) TaxID=1163671 RepID=UPI0004659735|nr:spore coat protein [Clostridium sp. 12(A)]
MTVLSGFAHMAGLTDQIIVTDFVTSLKSAIQNYGIAITEVTSPEIREILKKQLNDVLDTQEVISNYMVEKGFYHAYDIQEQKKEILKVSKVAIELSETKSK